LKKVEDDQLSYGRKLVELDKQGKVNNKRYEKIQPLVEHLIQDKINQAKVIDDYNSQWDKIEAK